MPYCVRCGNKLLDNALFCSQCGSKVEPTIEQDSKTEYNQQKYIQPGFNQSTEVNPAKKKWYKKKNNIVILSVSIAVVVISLVVVLIIVNNINNKVVIENDDGEDVFAFTLSEYLDRYNSNASDRLFVRDFEHIGDEFKLYEEDFSLTIDIYKTEDTYKRHDPCYIKSIYLMCYTDDRSVPDEAVDVLRGLYSNLSESEAEDILDSVIENGSVRDKEVKDLMVYFSEYDGLQTWHFTPLKI